MRRSTGNPANAASRTDGRDPDPSNRHTGATDCGSGLAWDAPAPHGQEMTLVSRVVVGEAVSYTHLTLPTIYSV